MNIVRAAVVSENKDIIRFFSLELQMIDVASEKIENSNNTSETTNKIIIP